jgi:predicted PurR-regulated permease PerM
LVALVLGPSAALRAVAVYARVRIVENDLVTPLVRQTVANLPPAVAITAVSPAGTGFGVLGLIAAAPLAPTVIATVKMLYVEDVPGDDLGVSVARSSG